MKWHRGRSGKVVLEEVIKSMSIWMNDKNRWLRIKIRIIEKKTGPQMNNYHTAQNIIIELNSILKKNLMHSTTIFGILRSSLQAASRDCLLTALGSYAPQLLSPSKFNRTHLERHFHEECKKNDNGAFRPWLFMFWCYFSASMANKILGKSEIKKKGHQKAVPLKSK